MGNTSNHFCPTISLTITNFKKTQLLSPKVPVTSTLPTNSSFWPNLGLEWQFPLLLPLPFGRWNCQQAIILAKVYWALAVWKAPFLWGSWGPGKLISCSSSPTWQVVEHGHRCQGQTPEATFCVGLKELITQAGLSCVDFQPAWGSALPTSIFPSPCHFCDVERLCAISCIWL